MKYRTWRGLGAVLLALGLLLQVGLSAGRPAYAADNVFGNTDKLDLTPSEDLLPSHDGSDGLAGGYVIDSYHVDVQVKEDNTYEVKETIEAYFTSTKHGLIRTIPTTGTYRREDGSSNSFRAKVTDIRANVKSTVERSNGKAKVKIGDAGSYVYGPKTYTISYRYQLGKDTMRGADELYFNLIGTSWDTTIGNVSFQITMPKEITEDQAKSLGFTSGGYGSSRTGDTLYQIKGNTIQGKLVRQLKSNQGFTVRMTLPEGYYVYPVDYSLFLVIGLALLGILAAVIFWLLFGNDKRVVESIQFYPPEGYNSLDVAMAYHGKVSMSDIPSLIPYLANEGYLTIKDKNRKNNGEVPISRGIVKNITFERVSHYSGSNESERLFMNGFFRSGSKVRHSDLAGSFHETCEAILKQENLHSKVKEENYTNREFSINAILLIFVALISFVAIFSGLYSDGASMLACLVSGLIFAAIMSFMAIRVAGLTRIGGVSVGGVSGLSIPALLWHIASSWIFLAVIFYAGKQFLSSLAGFFTYFTGGLLIRLLAAITATLIIAFFMHFMPKRTTKGDEIYGRILGFRTFLQTAQKDRLQMLVDENPQYFYNIIPFAYVLGVSKVWMDKFKDITMPAPSYVAGAGSRDPFWDYYYYSSLMDAVNHDIYHASVTLPASESSWGDSGSGSFGGGSGGGFSGGGSGGGGGSSW